MPVQILQSTRLFPPNTTANGPISTPLSILDATVTRFTPTGAIWLFDNLSSPESTFLSHLQISFTSTLNSFPHWAGQLQWTPSHPETKSHTHRSHRPMITYNDPSSDPGVEYTVIKSDQSIASLVPNAHDRASASSDNGNGTGIWVGDAFAQKIFLSSTQLALHNLRDYKDLPAMTVQITLCEEGGYAIGIQMAHCLADAQALMVFVHRWARACSSLHGNHSASSYLGENEPIFNPSLLDAHAAGDIDAEKPDPDLVSSARELPLHRYDWWDMSSPSYPAILKPTTENSKPSIELLQKTVLSPSKSCPWETWDLYKPVSYAQVHFTGAEIDAMREIARSDNHNCKISRLDALLAHIWSAINRARGLSEEEVFLNLSLGARSRVSPPLPDTYIGSPIFISHIKSTSSNASQASNVGEIAGQIRQTLNLFTPDKTGAMLHDAAHELAPQRLWQGFLGERHTLVTSWLRLGMYEVDFEGRGLSPRYVHAVMPKMDGCVQVMDSGVNDGGIDLALYLDVGVMRRLLQDNQLRGNPTGKD